MIEELELLLNSMDRSSQKIDEDREKARELWNSLRSKIGYISIKQIEESEGAGILPNEKKKNSPA